jgi:SAM-dependent methyltransferase
MRPRDHWRPSKYVVNRGRIRASTDFAESGIGSWLVTDAVARCYEGAIPRYARGRLVDLGCGKAPLFDAYRMYVTDVLWVDWAQSLHSNPDLDATLDLNERLPLPSGDFQTVILSDVLEHVANPALLVDEVGRILAPGGHLLMNVPFLYKVHERPHDYYRYTEFALRRFAEHASLRVLELRPIGGSVDVMADIAAKHVQHVPLVGGSLAWATQALAMRYRRTTSGRRLAVRTGGVFPLGYFMVAERAAH